jgi:hypothetical protein
VLSEQLCDDSGDTKARTGRKSMQVITMPQYLCISMLTLKRLDSEICKVNNTELDLLTYVSGVIDYFVSCYRLLSCVYLTTTTCFEFLKSCKAVCTVQNRTVANECHWKYR